MAKKRMFSLSVIDSDAFTDMPLSAQALYFHLCMRADDDGFIGNPKRIRGMIGASDDDLKLLIAKRFLLTFENGVIVIKHWRMHNTLQKDRYTPTDYLDERNMLLIKENKAYSFEEGEPVRSITEAKRKQHGNNLLPVVETECYRTVDNMEANCNQDVTTTESECFQNGNADKDKIKSSKDKDIDSDIDKGGSLNNPSIGNIPKDQQPSAPPPPDKKKVKKPYGQYKHVLLSEEDFIELRREYSDEDIQDGITYTDAYVQMKGNKQSDYKLALMKWGIDGGRKQRKKQHNKTPPTNSFNQAQMKSDYDMEQLEQAILSN